MKGVVEKLFDIDSIVIPEKLLNLDVDEQKVEASVQALSVRYAKEEAAESVLEGDLVYCQADKESYPDARTILVYTGMNLPDAREAEAAVFGKTVGDIVSTTLAGKKVTLTIKKILRRTPVEVNDKLVAGIGINGVNTVAAYKDYIRSKMQEDLKMENSKEIDHYFIDKMVQESIYRYDDAEMEAYVKSMIEQYASEDDPEGEMENVSPEEMRESIIFQAKQGWMAEAFCKEKGIEVDLASIEEDTDKMIEMMELMGEEVPDREELKKMATEDAYFDGFLKYINKIIDQKTGGSYGNC